MSTLLLGAAALVLGILLHVAVQGAYSHRVRKAAGEGKPRGAIEFGWGTVRLLLDVVIVASVVVVIISTPRFRDAIVRSVDRFFLESDTFLTKQKTAISQLSPEQLRDLRATVDDNLYGPMAGRLGQELVRGLEYWMDGIWEGGVVRYDYTWDISHSWVISASGDSAIRHTEVRSWRYVKLSEEAKIPRTLPLYRAMSRVRGFDDTELYRVVSIEVGGRPVTVPRMQGTFNLTTGMVEWEEMGPVTLDVEDGSLIRISAELILPKDESYSFGWVGDPILGLRIAFEHPPNVQPNLVIAGARLDAYRFAGAAPDIISHVWEYDNWLMGDASLFLSWRRL